MKIGIGLPNQVRDVNARIIPEWARRAEQAGFSAGWDRRRRRSA